MRALPYFLYPVDVFYGSPEVPLLSWYLRAIAQDTDSCYSVRDFCFSLKGKCLWEGRIIRQRSESIARKVSFRKKQGLGGFCEDLLLILCKKLPGLRMGPFGSGTFSKGTVRFL